MRPKCPVRINVWITWLLNRSINVLDEVCAHTFTLPPFLQLQWSGVLLTFPLLVKKFSVVYGIQRFMILFTTAYQLSLNWASPPSSYFLSIHFNIIWSSVPWYYKWSPSIRFPHQNSVWLPLLLHRCHTSHIIDHPSNIWNVCISLCHFLSTLSCPNS